MKERKRIKAFLLSSSIPTSDIRTIFLPAPVPLLTIKLVEQNVVNAMIKMSVSAECGQIMTGLLESIACFACTISLKSASSGFGMRRSMELTSDIGSRW